MREAPGNSAFAVALTTLLALPATAPVYAEPNAALVESQVNPAAPETETTQVSTEAPAQADTTQVSTDVPKQENVKEGWLDRGHASVENRAEKLAVWADNFFGSPRSVEESPTSVLRLRPRYEWDEEDGSEWKLRATGRLKLPQLNKRVSLVFIKDDNDLGEEFYDPGIASDGDSTAGLQYRLSKSDTSKVYLIAGMKAGPKGKLGGRYRFQVPFWSTNRFRFSEELFWIGGDGFGTLTRLDIDHSPRKETLWRWASKGEYSEESSGLEWSTRLDRAHKIDEKSAYRFYGFFAGETDSDLLTNRGFGAAYRRQFLREWLFWEIEPQYGWRKSEPEDEREGVATIQFKLEMVFGEL